jgi:recombination protein RecT
MSSELQQKVEQGEEKKDSLMLMLEHHGGQFERNLKLPDGKLMVDPERFVRVALTTIRTTPKLAEATHASLLGALMTCAMLGLEPGGTLGHAYLVPFEDRKKGEIEATLIIGYQGYIDLMYRSDRVAAVAAHAVYSHDDFYFELGTNAHVLHRPKLEDRGELVAVYGIGELVTGAKPFEVLSKSKIEEARKKSKTDKIWKSDYEAMARKTGIRRLSKWMPSSIAYQAASIADGRSLLDVPDRLEDIPELIDIEAEEAETEDES